MNGVFHKTGTRSKRRTVPLRGQRMTCADRGRSSCSRPSAAGRSRARSLSLEGSQMPSDGIGEPEVRLTQKEPRSRAAPPDGRSSTAAAAHLGSPQQPRVRRHASSRPSAAERSNATHRERRHERSRTPAGCATDLAVVAEDGLDGCAALRRLIWRSVGREAAAAVWIAPKSPGLPRAIGARAVNPFLRGTKEIRRRAGSSKK